MANPLDFVIPNEVRNHFARDCARNPGIVLPIVIPNDVRNDKAEWALFHQTPSLSPTLRYVGLSSENRELRTQNSELELAGI